MCKVLSLQADFLAEKPQLQLVIKAAGHKCYFLPKFHYGTFPTARRLVPKILDACPTKVIRVFYWKIWRYMDTHRKGLNAKQAEYAVKKYCSHCKVGAGIMMDMAILNNPE
ncbi:hypothetical protein P692DRAFT_20850118 [Suillus brevipes Sb2]|nr:hypothetical protein P692DRAFT_20850118 [Suillus brevipes Sb2]